ncbi:integrase [Pseudomonas sp. JAI115]|uniref:tyrosine-type recombinase/integrase n=1 Tax=Pseudomonas sp. JAI115 TaxID=2723061 RepID=UPI0016132E77|nr:tyrosine-type recombinase/integrase [Pseudomonas sp. JAI115]MBB6155147.1 integrase [Pseudomonas sp. JAI115]
MPDMPYCEIRMIRTASNRLRPYLLVDGVPVILANLWAEDLLHKSRLNTVENYLRDIAIAYEWGLSRDSSLERKLERFAVFSSTELTSLAERLCSTKRGAGASQATCKRRFEAIKSYIDFSFEHYVELNRLSLLEQIQAEKNKNKNLQHLKKKIIKIAQQSEPSLPATPLDSSEQALVMDILSPGNSKNPFKSTQTQARNYCLFLVMLETLARRGEAVLIELDDVELGRTPTIRIKRPSDVNRERRNDGASLKTRGRIVPISASLAAVLGDYISNNRAKLLKPKRPCTALFVSSRDGRRLSARTINTILRIVAGILSLIKSSKRIHPHGLRSTGANIARKKLENSRVPSINVNDALAYLGGWSPNGQSVQSYSRQAISDRLGELLRESEIRKSRGNNDD